MLFLPEVFTDHCTVETGEEDEETEYSCYSKLYHFVKSSDSPTAKKEWKERGSGVVKLNVRKSDNGPLSQDEDGLSKAENGDEPDYFARGANAAGSSNSSIRARLLMRANGSHRVILNTQIRPEFKFGTPSGDRPSGPSVHFMSIINGQLEMMQMKVSPPLSLGI